MERVETYIAKLQQFNLSDFGYQNTVVKLLASIQDINRQMNFERKTYYLFVISFLKQFDIIFYVSGKYNDNALESVPLFITSVASGIRTYYPEGFEEFIEIGKSFFTDDKR